MGVAFLDFMSENESNVTQIKAVQTRLRESNILQVSAASDQQLQTQELSLPENGYIVGKRQRLNWPWRNYSHPLIDDQSSYRYD